MDARNKSKIWDSPTKQKIDGLIEEGISILQRDTQKSLKEFKEYIQNVINEEDILR